MDGYVNYISNVISCKYDFVYIDVNEINKGVFIIVLNFFIG